MSAEIIFRYFPLLSEKQKSLFSELGSIYKYWNSRVNLISRKDMDNFYLHHVLHSLSLAKVVQLDSGSKVLDVGTGGGFPGIPMAIFFPNCEFHLIDSIGKKVKLVNDIANQLGITNVLFDQIRVEDLYHKYDFVLGRAVTNVDVFCGWTKKNISLDHRHSIPNGILYMKGPEFIKTSMRYDEYCIKDFFEEGYFIEKKILHIY